MSKITLFYGKETLKANSLENLMRESISLSKEASDEQSANLHDTVCEYDLVILGISKYNKDELEDDWEDFIENLDENNLLHKSVVLYGFGDEVEYAENFLVALGIISEKIAYYGTKVIGSWSMYTNIHQDNQYYLLDEKVNKYIELITPYFEPNSLAS